MAQPDLEKFSRRALALAMQVADGTPVAPSTATDGIRLYNGQSGTEHDSEAEEYDRPFFTADEMVLSNHRAFISGGFRLLPPSAPGHATNGAMPGEALLLCGGMTRVLDAQAEITRYNPVSAGILPATAYWWHAGTHKRVTDARGAITALAMEVGKRFGAEIRLVGSYENVLEAALPVVNVPSATAAVTEAENSVTQVTVLPGGDPLNVWGKALVVDFGSELNSTQYTELKRHGIQDRKASYTLRIARTAKADFDPWALMRTHTLIAATMRTTGPGTIYSELGIRGQITGVNEVEIDGDYGWEITGPCIASPTGGDEFYIEFGDAD